MLNLVLRLKRVKWVIRQIRLTDRSGPVRGDRPRLETGLCGHVLRRTEHHGVASIAQYLPRHRHQRFINLFKQIAVEIQLDLAPDLIVDS